MITAITALFTMLRPSKKAQPAQLTEIVAGFQDTIDQLEQRIQFDKDEIKRNDEEMKRLAGKSTKLENDVDQAGRIKSKIEQLIK